MHPRKVFKAASLCLMAILTTLSLTSPAEAASQEQVIHAFQLGSDGGFPTTDLLSDSAGNLYGTTEEGGTYGLGTVFELSPQPDGGWTEQILYDFQGGSDGGTPTSGVIADAAGNLYGETAGGANSAGTVYELSLSDGAWTLTNLFTFVDEKTGMFPSGGLALDAQGNLYGTTQSGGGPLAAAIGPLAIGLRKSFMPLAETATADCLWPGRSLASREIYSERLSRDTAQQAPSMN